MLRKSIAAPNSPEVRANDSFGCPFDKLYKNQSILSSDITVLRKGTRENMLEQVATPASGRGFAIGVSTLGGHRRQIFHEHHATTHLFERDSVYVRSLGDAYKADLSGPFDFLLLEISPVALRRIAEEAELPAVASLNPVAAEPDPVLASLARALIPALENPQTASRLFIDQLTAAIGTHIVQHYGNRIPSSGSLSRKLSRAHENLAKSMLVEHLDGDIQIVDVARACNLSRGYFIRAFRDTTGMTPYQWLLSERIARARALLLGSDVSLSEVAISCGFADQSHFTRVFTSVVGTTPGNWRRNA